MRFDTTATLSSKPMPLAARAYLFAMVSLACAQALLTKSLPPRIRSSLFTAIPTRRMDRTADQPPLLRMRPPPPHKLRPLPQGYAFLDVITIPPPGNGTAVPKPGRYRTERLPIVILPAHQIAVADKPKSVQFLKTVYNLGPDGVQMDIAHQLLEIGIFLAKDELVAVLERMAATVTDGG